MSAADTLKIGGVVIAQSYGYGTIAVFLISLLSLLGVVLVPFLSKTYYSYLILGLIALAIGTMSGDAFLHLIPQALGLHEHSHSDIPHGPLASSLTSSFNNSIASHDHGHSDHSHQSEEQRGNDVVWKLLVVIGTIFVFHLMEVLLRFMQATLDRRRGKVPSSHHHHHHHNHGHSQGSLDSVAGGGASNGHNHIVIPALAIPMHPRNGKKNEEKSVHECSMARERGQEVLPPKDRVKDQNAFRKWLLAKRSGCGHGKGSHLRSLDEPSCLAHLTNDTNLSSPDQVAASKRNRKGVGATKGSSSSSAKLVICPDNYLEEHDNHYDVVGRYQVVVQGDGNYGAQDRQADDPNPGSPTNPEGTPVLLRVCLNESSLGTNREANAKSLGGTKTEPPCRLKDCDPGHTTFCQADSCDAQPDRVEHRHHEHKHDHTSCHHRDIMQAPDIINTRKRELQEAQALASKCSALVSEESNDHYRTPFSGSADLRLPSGHVNEALTGDSGKPCRTVSTVSAPAMNESVYTTSPEQLLLESSTYPLEKDLSALENSAQQEMEKVKFKGGSGLPFCYGIQSLSLFLILGDIAHNIVDGIAIGAAFSSSLKEGLSTSFAVFCHELPHELGDFAVLISTGMSFKMALMVNLFAACTSFLGLYISLSVASSLAARQWIFAMTAGMFLYVSLVDMLPELREIKVGSQIWSLFCQNLGIIVGVGLMLLVALYEHLLF